MNTLIENLFLANQSLGNTKSESYLEPKNDARKSFYNKAVEDGDKLYSYGTLVAEIKDGQPIVYNVQSQTTLRHVKEWLLQKGFTAINKKQIIKDYGSDDIKVD